MDSSNTTKLSNQNNNEEKEDTIEQSILSKVKNFFDLHKKLRYEKLNDFLDSINLAEVFSTEEEKELIWSIFTDNSEGLKEIDYESCCKGMSSLFEFYGIGESEHNGENQTNQTKDQNISSNAPRQYSSSDILLSPSSKVITNFRESMQNKEKKLDDLLTRISLKKNEDKVPHYNTPIFDANPNNPKKSHHTRSITKTFTAIDIDKLQQLRKVFSLLDLRNKDSVFISDLQEVIRKYKFIKLTQEELINFLSLISDDLINHENSFINENTKGNILKLSINFELYSRAISVIEQQLLQVNSDTFVEHNDSYEVKESYSDMIEELNSVELENLDYVMVLADLVKNLQWRINESVVENYDKILNNNFNGNETKESIKENIQEGLEYLKNKTKDIEIFLKEMSLTSHKKQNKLNYLKIIVDKINSDFKLAEEDYRNLFQKYNNNSTNDVDEELERLFEENRILNEQKEEKEIQVEKLEKKLYDKDEVIFSLQNKIESQMITDKDKDYKYSVLNSDFESMKKNYEHLMNEIYEKIKSEDKNKSGQNFYNSDSKIKSKNFQNNLSYNTPVKNTPSDNKINKLLSKSEESRKLAEMNHEQLIIYTLDLEITNKRLEEKVKSSEQRIKQIENELNELRKQTSENNKTTHLTKLENERLQKKINEMTRDIEINSIFRPSNVLGSRISVRKSDISMAISKDNPSRFNKIQKVFESDPNQIKTNNKLNNPPTEKGETLNNTTIKNEIQTSFAPSSNQTLNKSAKIDHSHIEASMTNMNVDFSRKDSFINNEKFLFDEKKETKTYTLGNFYENGEENNDNIDNLDPMENYENKNTTNIFNSRDSLGREQTENYNDKEYIVDCIEDNDHIGNTEGIAYDNCIESNDNPFTVKRKESINTNNSVDLLSIVRHSPIDIDIDLEKREKLKQIAKDSLTNSIKNTTFKKVNGKIPSMITEEILEEDNNGEIIGTGLNLRETNNYFNRNSTGNNFNTRPSTNTLARTSSLDEGDGDEKIRMHKRMDTIEDIGLIFNKDSQYMCYDFLTLRKTEAIIKMFEDNHEDVSSYEMFSDNIYLIDESNKKSKKNIFITSSYVYILRPYDLGVKSRISLRTLDKITISNKNCNLLAFHFKESDDIVLEILRRMELLYFFRDLYRMKRYGKLKFKYSDNFKIKRNNVFSTIIVDKSNDFSIAPNFDGAQKLGYLSKLCGTIFTRFNERLVVLTNVGLLYFEDPNKQPKKLIPVIGSEVVRVDEKKYKKKHCFEIKTLNGESYVFATNSNEDLESWIQEFKLFKKNYEKKIKNLDGKK